MTISHNQIHDDTFGIWLSTTVTADGVNHNHFNNVTTPITGGWTNASAALAARTGQRAGRDVRR